jgi:ABC-type nitrate/sulfonate/bicarbonate transport system ATPase subunit
VFVTHNLSEAIMLADRIALLSPATTRVAREVDVPLTLEQRFHETAIERARHE